MESSINKIGNFNSNFNSNNFVADNNNNNNNHHQVDDRFNVLAVPSRNPRRHYGEL